MYVKNFTKIVCDGLCIVVPLFPLLVHEIKFLMGFLMISKQQLFCFLPQFLQMKTCFYVMQSKNFQCYPQSNNELRPPKSPSYLQTKEQRMIRSADLPRVLENHQFDSDFWTDHTQINGDASIRQKEIFCEAIDKNLLSQTENCWIARCVKPTYLHVGEPDPTVHLRVISHRMTRGTLRYLCSPLSNQNPLSRKLVYAIIDNLTQSS